MDSYDPQFVRINKDLLLEGNTYPANEGVPLSTQKPKWNDLIQSQKDD